MLVTWTSNLPVFLLNREVALNVTYVAAKRASLVTYFSLQLNKLSD